MKIFACTGCGVLMCCETIESNGGVLGYHFDCPICEAVKKVGTIIEIPDEKKET